MIRFVLVTCVIIALFLLALAGWINWWLFGAMATVYSGVMVYASASIQSGFYVNAMCRLTGQSNAVALTFDDGPDPVQTPIILDLLKEAGFKATFFCIGSKIKAHPALVQRIVDEGHVVGNHTYSHSNLFPLFSPRRMKRELIETQQLIDAIAPSSKPIFRPPYGVTNPLVYWGLKGLGVNVIGWNIRSFDTTNRSEEQVYNRIARQLKGGDIILLHDTSQTVVGVLKRLIPHLKAKGQNSISIHA